MLEIGKRRKGFMSDLILASVYGSTESIDGYSQSELNTLWWKNFLELSDADNTLFWDDSNIERNPYNKGNDSTDDVTLSDLAENNRIGNIQLLAGVYNQTNTATRTITIDPSYNLFFPIVNTTWIPEMGETTGYPGILPKYANEVKTILNESMAGASDLHVSIDGIEIPNIKDYFQKANNKYFVSYGGLLDDPNPDDGITEVGPTYAAGFYMGISALPAEVNGHTIHFQGSILKESKKASFTLDITYNIRYEFNEVIGTNGNDLSLNGTAQSDLIQGLDGADVLIGMEGNDNLNGGNNNDLLIGTNPELTNPGFGEIDILNGGEGADTFVLGGRSTAYYLGNGSRDYALIKDLTQDDTVQLHQVKGSQSYTFTMETLLGHSGTAISLGDDLIAFVEGVTALNQASPQIDFI